MIINLSTKRILRDTRVTNISESFTHKMAAKTSWHRYGRKLRHCHRNYVATTTSIVAFAQTMHRLQPEINIQQMACCI